MKVRFEIENGKPLLIIKYEREEWEKIESILKRLGLERSRTQLGFNKNLTLEYYRERDMELLNYLRKYFRDKMDYITDDINRSVYDNGYFNIAVFRVIPDGNYEVKILLDKYLTIAELKFIFEKIRKVYELLVNIALRAECEIKIEG